MCTKIFLLFFFILATSRACFHEKKTCGLEQRSKISLDAQRFEWEKLLAPSTCWYNRPRGGIYLFFIQRTNTQKASVCLDDSSGQSREITPCWNLNLRIIYSLVEIIFSGIGSMELFNSKMLVLVQGLKCFATNDAGTAKFLAIASNSSLIISAEAVNSNILLFPSFIWKLYFTPAALRSTTKAQCKSSYSWHHR